MSTGKTQGGFWIQGAVEALCLVTLSIAGRGMLEGEQPAGCFSSPTPDRSLHVSTEESQREEHGLSAETERE